MKISAATTENLLYDPAELEAAGAIAVLVPGAFSSIGIFEPVQSWRREGYGLAHYRFPALDGRPLAPPLRVGEAAAEIKALAGRYPGKPFRLLGYSTGGAIALTAATRMPGDVRVAAMSSAVERAGGHETSARVLRDLAQAALVARSLRLEPVWLAYYAVLLFGRQVLRDPDLAARAAAIIAARRDRIVLPDKGKPRAHTRDLRRWRLPPGVRFRRDQLRFFWGAEDPVFSRGQMLGFAQKLGGAPVTAYPGQGHLLFASHLPVFEDIRAFFEGCAPVHGGGADLSP